MRFAISPKYFAPLCKCFAPLFVCFTFSFISLATFFKYRVHPYKCLALSCKRLAPFFFALIILTFSLPVFSQETAPSDSSSAEAPLAQSAPPAMGVIKDIRFIGLVRTSKKWLMSMFGAFIGCPLPYFQKAQLEGGLRALDLFREINIDLIKESEDDASNAIILVTVKEKWSIFGAVFGWGDYSGFVGGVAYADMNLGGRKNILVATGNFGEHIQEGTFTCIKIPMGVKKPGLIVSANVSNNHPEYTDFDGDKIIRKQMLRTGVSLSVMGISPWFMYTLGWGYSYTGWYNEDTINLHVNTISASLSKGWDARSEWFPLPRSLGVGAKLDLDWARWALPMGELTANAIYSVSAGSYKRMFFQFGVWGGMTFERPITMQFNRDTVKSFIAQSPWATDMLLSGRASWETGLFRAKFLTMSLFASFEAIVGRDIKIDKSEAHHLDVLGDNSPVWAIGPGAGVKIYFHEISIPTMMMGAFYNINQNKWQFGFSVGI